MVQMTKHLFYALEATCDAICEADPKTGSLHYSPKFFKSLGFRPAEVPKTFQEWELFIHPDDRDDAVKAFKNVYSGVEQEYQIEYRIKAKDGRIKWVLSRGVNYEWDADGNPLKMLGTLTDITDRMNATRKLAQANCELEKRVQEQTEKLQSSKQKLKNLSAHLMEAQELERKRISLELHDELGQSLTALKLKIRAIEMRLQGEQGSELNEVLQYIDLMIENARRLSHDLSPVALEDLGFSLATQQMVQDFVCPPDVELLARIDNVDNLFRHESQIVLYRVIQEALTNAIRHADATQIWVLVRKRAKDVVVMVSDNGKGIDFPIDKENHENFGLCAMRERVAMLNGSIEFKTRVKRWTKVVAVVPFEQGEGE